jgi:hypothetical protein
LLDGLFAHPAWLFSVASNLDICTGYRGQNEFFRSLLEQWLCQFNGVVAEFDPHKKSKSSS